MNRASLSPRKAAYLKEHFLDFSDGKLAKSLNIDKKIVRDYLSTNGLIKPSEKQQKAQNGDSVPPPYEAELPLPARIHPFPCKHLVFSLLVFLVSFIIYFRTLAPTVTGEDSGELITAAYTLGVAHPPGYPLWCMLGKLFSMVIPAGSIAFRVNLMSALWSAAAVALLFPLLFKFTANIPVSFGGALSFAFFTDVWGQAIIAEVYSLNVFFVVLILLLVVSYHCRRDVRLVWSLAFVSALALTHHNTAAPVVCLSWAFVLYISPKRLLKPKSISIFFLLLLLGLSVYLYLPVRSAANPPVDWGNPETLSALLDHILRRQYAFGYTEHPRSLDFFLNQMSIFGRSAASQASYAFLCLTLAGLIPLWRKDKNWFAFLIAVIVIGGPLLIFVINFELEREAVETVRPFFLPVYLAACILSAVCFAEIFKLIPQSKFRSAAYGCMVLLPIFPLLAHYQENDKSRYFYAHDYGKNLLDSVEKGGIIFSSSDHSTFPLIYFQSVEKLREDIIIADKYGYIEKNLYAHMPHEITSHFRKIPTPQERHMIERWILTDTSRPIFFTKKRDMQDFPSLELTPWGLTYKLVKKSDADTIVKPDLWASYELRSLESDSPKDYSAHSILCDYYFARGRDYLYEGEKDKALKQFDLVIQEGWGVKEIYNNLGSVCAENGLLSESIAYFEKALELDPDYLLALQNLVKLHEHIGDYEKAIEYQKSLLGARPDDPEILLHIATLYERMHDLENAVKTYHSVTRLAPQDFRPYRSLGYIYLSLPQARPDAALMFSKSLDRNPDQPDVKRLLNNLWGGKSTAVEQTANVLR